VNGRPSGNKTEASAAGISSNRVRTIARTASAVIPIGRPGIWTRFDTERFQAGLLDCRSSGWSAASFIGTR